jgi:hypothetical protein
MRARCGRYSDNSHAFWTGEDVHVFSSFAVFPLLRCCLCLPAARFFCSSLLRGCRCSVLIINLRVCFFLLLATCSLLLRAGYFTSRPALKRLVRYSSAYLNMARQIEVFAGLPGLATQPLEEVRASFCRYSSSSLMFLFPVRRKDLRSITTPSAGHPNSTLPLTTLSGALVHCRLCCAL